MTGSAQTYLSQRHALGRGRHTNEGGRRNCFFEIRDEGAQPSILGIESSQLPGVLKRRSKIALTRFDSSQLTGARLESPARRGLAQIGSVNRFVPARHHIRRDQEGDRKEAIAFIDPF